VAVNKEVRVMSRKARWACIVVAVSFASVCCVIAYLVNKGEMDAAALERQMGREVPLGSSRVDVEQWVRAKGLELHEIRNDEGKNVGLDGTTIKWYPPGWSGELKVICFFDDEDKLVKYHVAWIPNVL
jgi:hypothetical protein